MKAKFVNRYFKKVEDENGNIKHQPRARYEVVGDEAIADYLENVPVQYQRFLDEDNTRPLFNTRVYKAQPDNEITVVWNEELKQHISPNIIEDKNKLLEQVAFTADNLL